MKKIIITTIAISLACNAWANQGKKDRKKEELLSKKECAQYEVKEDNYLYKNGIKIESGIETMKIDLQCKNHGIKGMREARERSGKKSDKK